jgi:hypothetical protein
MTYKYIELSRGFKSKVDAADFDELNKYSWHYNKAPKDKTGYAVSSTPPYRNKKMHRVILDAHHGEVVDHLNRDTLDNTRKNIHITTLSFNCINRVLKNKYGAGVSKVDHGFTARITINGVRTYLGYFKTVGEASKKYKEERKKHYDL